MKKKSTLMSIKKKGVNSYLRNNWQLYLFLLPGLLLLLVFKYVPMVGNVIAFQDYKLGAGYFESNWVGLKNYIEFFNHRDFKIIVTNTIIINFLKLIIGFPAPILFAIILNEIKNRFLKKTVQTLSYLPHFLSWVIIGGIMIYIFSTSNGLINQVRSVFGLETVAYLTSKESFRMLLVISDMWKSTGWGTIIFLAAITTINPELYESCKIDGAGSLSKRFISQYPV